MTNIHDFYFHQRLSHNCQQKNLTSLLNIILSNIKTPANTDKLIITGRYKILQSFVKKYKKTLQIKMNHFRNQQKIIFLKIHY